MKHFFVLIFVSLFFSLKSQNRSLDSLYKLLTFAKSDSVKINIHLSIADEFFQSDLKRAESSIFTAIQLSKKVNSKASLVETYGYMGYIKDMLSELDSSAYYYQNAIILCKTINDTQTLPVLLNNLSAIKIRKGNLQEAADLQISSIKIFEKNKDQKGLSYAYNNLGELFWKMTQKKKAIDYFLLAQNLSNEIGYTEISAYATNNLGAVYYDSKEYKQAFIYFKKAVELYDSIGDLKGKAKTLQNIGRVFAEQKDIVNATRYTKEAFSIYSNLKYSTGVIQSGLALGTLLQESGKLNEALVWHIKTLALIKQTNELTYLPNLYRELSDIYAQQHEYEKAYEYHYKFMQTKDSLYDIESNNKMQELEAQYQNEKKNLEIDNLKTKEALKDAELQKQFTEAKKQNQQKIIFASALFVMILLAVLIYRNYALKKRDNLVITNQKIEVERQKQIIEDHQREMNDSIKYAKRIQDSFFASDEEFEKFKMDYFKVFLPKDVVSGDFYWANASENNMLYLAVADSTGHGIPGAFMSLLNISLLNEALYSRQLFKTSDVLNFVRKILILGLKADREGQGGNDGMDCVLIAINSKSLQLDFTGANNPLWIVRKNNQLLDIIELKPNKMPVGRSPKQDINFENEYFQLQKGDMLYLFTDGYADQFGGDNGKKFKNKQLSHLLLSVSQLPIAEQSSVIKETFAKWKGDLEQVDDVTVIGIRIS